MDSKNDIEGHAVKNEALERNAEKINKKTTMKQVDKSDRNNENRRSLDKGNEKIAEEIMKQRSGNNEELMKKDGDDDKNYKKKETKIQGREDKRDKTDFEKPGNKESDNVVIGMNKENIKSESKVNEKEKEIYIEDEKDKIDEYDSNNVLVKKVTLKKQNKEENGSEIPVAETNDKRANLKESIPQDSFEDFTHRKSIFNALEPIEEIKNDTKNKKTTKKQTGQNLDKPHSGDSSFSQSREPQSPEALEKHLNPQENPTLTEKSIKPKKSKKKSKPEQGKDNLSDSNKPKTRNSNSSMSSNHSSEKIPQDATEKSTDLISNLINNKIMHISDPQEKSQSPPGTPNSDSLSKPSIKPKKNQNPAYSSENSEKNEKSENKKLQAKLHEYEEVIKKQNEEIQNLKSQLNQQNDKSKPIFSSNPSNFLNKKLEIGLFKKQNANSIKDDMDFWKILDEPIDQSDPKKLEDISALKDLWILNTDSGQGTFSNTPIKKTQGIKPNALTRTESSKINLSKSRVLPKISSIKTLKK